MLKHARFVLLAFLLLAIALPASAAERVEKLPEVKAVMSARFDIALALNNLQFIVGKGEVASATRAHFVLRALPVGGSDAATVEVVVYDGKVYTREDASTQWYVQSGNDLPVDAPTSPPQVDASSAPISSIGSRTIAGTPTNQYQIWIADGANTTDHVALDFFIGQQVNYLHQYQISAFATDEDFGELKLEQTMRLYDFDDRSIVVGPPANAIERPAMAGLLKPVVNGGLLSTLAAPLSTYEVRQMAATRLAR